ncbi:MAG TPA: DUF2975 domain-containing protein [Rhizomicrobium sp.]|nr:DUF2975 domain-containing protein [Rhizomicrobium sp.]
MSNLLVFDTAAPPPTAAQLRLRRSSAALATLFAILMGLSILSVAAWLALGIFFDNHLAVGTSDVVLNLHAFKHVPPGYVLLSSQSFALHLAGFADIALATAPVFFVCLHLRALFRLYAEGIVFAQANAAHLKAIGLWLVAYPFLKFAANLIFRAAGGTDTAWFRAELMDALILGLIVLAIAQVMEFGREIEQDRAEIV